MEEAVKTQAQIEAEIEAEMVIVRAENEKAIRDGVCFLVVLFSSLAIIKYWVLASLFV